MRSRLRAGMNAPGNLVASLAALLLAIIGCDDNACIRQSDCGHGMHCSAELVCEADPLEDGGGDGGSDGAGDRGGDDGGDAGEIGGADASDASVTDLESPDSSQSDLTSVDAVSLPDELADAAAPAADAPIP